MRGPFCARWKTCRDLRRARHQDRRQRRRAQSGRLRARRRGRSTSDWACARWSRTSRATTCCRELAELQAQGEPLTHLDKGIPLAPLQAPVVTRQRLPRRLGHRRGAASAAPTSSSVRASPMPRSRSARRRGSFGWARDDWDRLAAGVVAGHIIECGAQCTGGNYSLLQGGAAPRSRPASRSPRCTPTAAS